MAIATVFIVIVFFYGLASRRLRTSILSSAIVFLSSGLIVGIPALGLIDIAVDAGALLVLGELALALILFNDSARMKLSVLKGNDLPARMLAIGLPLTIGLGAIAAAVLFADLSIWEAAILGTVLAPTDAGLGKQVVHSKNVPVRIRQTLNVEAGLNDGIAVPFLLIFLTAAEASDNIGASDVWQTFAVEVGFGLLIGMTVGIGGGYLLKNALKAGRMTTTYRSLAFPAMALAAFVTADTIGGSGFIAAFTGGLATAWILSQVDEDLVAFIEAEGQIINLGVFFIFGVIAASMIASIDVFTFLYALLSLTLIRMLPVAISLIGKKLRPATVLFLGWFGPRGLASIVLGLLVLEEAPQLAGLDRIQLVITTTIILSVFAHGLSTNPAIRAYGRHADSLSDEASEKREAPEAAARGAY